MNEATEKYQRALEQASDVIGTVPAGSWENQSPCEEWKAVDVVGHLVQGQRWVASLGNQSEVAESSLREAAGDDPPASWQQATWEALASFTPESLARVVPTPFGEMPLERLLTIFTLDVIAHTWDLAQAVGIDVSLDPELVHERFEAVKPLDDLLRSGSAFGPKQAAPAGASEQDQLMAFLGRKV